MINLIQAGKLGLKKIKFNKGKSLFVILPIGLMFAIIVFAASEAMNLVTVAHNSIFSPIQSQNEIIELNKSSTASPMDLFSDTSSSNYTQTDNALISAIKNVEEISLVNEIPIDIIKSDNVFSGKTINISSLAGLDSSFAKLYTNQDFNYTDNKPIPIILNANDFNATYVDWAGKTEIDVDFTKANSQDSATALTSQSPIKTSAISYNRNDLIGKTITVSFGGLNTISDIQQESTSTGFKYTQKTQTELDSEVSARQTAISKYWDYSIISKPLVYTFVIAGISEGSDKTKTYIPEQFAETLMKQYLANEASARNSTAIPTADQNATYTGLVYDGVTLTKDTTSTVFAGIRNQVNNQISSQVNTINSQIDSQNSAINSANAANRATFEKLRAERQSSGGSGGAGGTGQPPSGGNFSFRSITSSVQKLNASNISVTYAGMPTSYSIPGLVYSKDRTTSSITGEYTGFTTGSSVPLSSQTILIKINDLTNRDQVITDLNSKGYRYQDYSQYKQYSQLESYINLALNIGSITFMVITALFILINMAKFVSEGKREIGIFRAIGATKGDIRLIFILQTVGYILISVIFGAVLGVASIFALSNLIMNSAQTLITSTLGSSIVLSQQVSLSNFMAINYQMILIYSGILLMVTLLVSLIPSSQAARVSPVEAIRNS